MITESEKTTFKDTKGRDWSLRISTGRAMRLREKGIDVARILEADNDLLRSLIDDTWGLVEIIETLVADQLAEKSIDRMDFLDSLEGEVLDEATVVFLHCVTLILPKHKRRALQAMIRKISTGIEIASATMETKIADLDIETEIGKAFGS